MSRSAVPFGLALILLVTALGALAGRVPHALDALAAVQVQLAAAAALAAGAMLAARRRVSAGVAALAAALALGGADEFWSDAARAAAPGPSREITFVTANVFYENARVPDLARALAALDADIFATVETPDALLKAPGPLGELYPHRRSWRLPNGRGGPTLWSRFPFVEAKTERGGGHPGHLIASVDAGLSRPLQVMVLHLDWPVTGGQGWQYLDFHRFWPLLEAPLIVAGDFNAAPWSAMTRRVEDITRTQVLGGWRPTFFGGVGGRSGRLRVPMGLPIDHILASPEIGARWVRTAPLPGSDHRAVAARLVLPERAAPE